VVRYSISDLRIFFYLDGSLTQALNGMTLYPRGVSVYSLFESRYRPNTGVIRPAGAEYVRRVYQREVDKVIHYHQSRFFYLKNDHILVRLIVTAFRDAAHTLPAYVESIRDRTDALAKSFQFTSPVSRGKIWDGDFYGPGSQEIILAVDDEFDIGEVQLKWRELASVTVLTHPVSNLQLLLPDGSSQGNIDGLSVICVNIPLLLLQFRLWVDEQEKLGESTNQVAVSGFVRKYVLPNMMKTHTDLAALNLALCSYYEIPRTRPARYNPFMVVDYEDKAIAIYKETMDHFENGMKLYLPFMKSLFSIFAEDAQEALLMPDMARTRQVWWALILARLPFMQFLMTYGGHEGVQSNRRLWNSIKIDLERLRGDQGFSTTLPREMQTRILADVDSILSYIKE